MVEFVDGITRLDLSQGYSINSLILNKMTDSPNTFSKSLGSINIKDNSNLIIKTWQFNYDYFVDPNPLKTFMYQNNCVGVITSPVVDVSTLNSDKYKLKLLSVQEFSAEPQINLPAYQFDYFDSVIRNLSMNLDHWGFNNFDGVNTNTDLIPSLYLRGSLYMQSSCNSYVTNRNSNWPAMRGGTLKKITYPTGGNIQFEFEPNTVLNENNLNTIVGGLRIKKIIKDFKNNIPIEITDYQYNENNGNSSGVLYGTPYYFQVIKNEMLSTALGCEKSGCDCTSDSLSSYYSSNSIKPLELTQGSHIGYKTVKEIYKNNGYKIRTFFDDKSNYNYSALPFQNFISNQITSNTTTGYKIFYNSIPSLSCIDNIDAPNFPTPPQPFFPTRGALTSEKIYDENGKLKKQTDYLTKFKLSYIAIPGIQSIVFFIRRYSDLYYLTTYKKFSENITETIKDSLNDLVTLQQIYYDNNNHNSKTKEIFTDSKQDQIIKNYKYSLDLLPNWNSYYFDNDAFIFFTNWPLLKYAPFRENCRNASDETGCLNNIFRNVLLQLKSSRMPLIVHCKSILNANLNILNNSLTNNSISGRLASLLVALKKNQNLLVENYTLKTNKLQEATYYEYDSNLFLDVSPVQIKKISQTNSNGDFTPISMNSNSTDLQIDNQYSNFANVSIINQKLINYVDVNNITTSYDYNNLNLIKSQTLNAKNDFFIKTIDTQIMNYFTLYIRTDNSPYFTPSINFTLNKTSNVVVTISNYVPIGSSSITFNYILNNISSGSNSITGQNTTSITFNNLTPGNYNLIITNFTNFQSFSFNCNASISYIDTYTKLLNNYNSETFNENFEDNPLATTGSAHSGDKFYSSSFNVPFNPPNNRKYILQYYQFQNNIWAFKQQNYVTNTNLSGPVDDIRIFPEDALMTSYIYKPFIGITAEINPQGITTFYNYDKFQRLIQILDNEKNIINTYDYNYAFVIYSSTQQTITKTRNNCTIGGTGGSYTYNVLAGNQTSSISQDDANTLAINNNQTNAQNAANTYANCIYSNTQQTITKTRNNCTIGGTGGSYNYIVLAGTQTSSISQDDANTLAINNNQTNAQNAANNYASCTFYNDTFSILKARNNCGNGYIFGYYRYFVAANLISSNISKSDANTVAYNTYQSAAQDAANLYGSCIACYGVNQKIVNSVCLTGIKQIISKTYNPKLDRTTVTYNYVFSDGTTSINYVEYLDGNQTGGGTDPGGNPIQQ